MSKRCRTANLAPGFVLHGSIPRWIQSTNHNLSFMTNVQTVRTSVSLPNPNPRLVGSLELLGEGRTQTSCRIHAVQRNGGLQQLRVPAEDGDPATLWGGASYIQVFLQQQTAASKLTPGLFFCVFQDLNKRLSLPADIRIPDGYLEKLQLSSPPFDQPLSRRSRRASLVSPPASVEAFVPFYYCCAALPLCRSPWQLAQCERRMDSSGDTGTHLPPGAHQIRS